MKKRGTEYELFVKQIYECLNRADGLSDVTIQHNVKLKGASNVEHQIDVYWCFKKAGITYKVAIECKDYQSRVSKDRVMAFHAVLQDVGDLHGVFVSRMGFQSGAIEYAKKNGIQLMIIRPPIEKDWEGRVKDIHLNLVFRTIDNVQVELCINRSKAENIGFSITDNNRQIVVTAQSTIAFEQMVTDGKCINTNDKATIEELIKNLPSDVPSGKNTYTYTFTGGWVDLGDIDAILPVDSICFEYDVLESEEVISLYGEDMIKAIVKDITEGKETRVDKFGRTSIREST